NGGLITFPGGLPLKTKDGQIIGAIGVSGSSVENYPAVATARAEGLSKEFPSLANRNLERPLHPARTWRFERHGRDAQESHGHEGGDGGGEGEPRRRTPGRPGWRRHGARNRERQARGARGKD